MGEVGLGDVYRMNPAEDVLVYGGELQEGMWVLAEDTKVRRPHGDSEDDRLRRQRFRRVTRLQRRPPAFGGGQPMVAFVGEWVDGYQEPHSYNASWAWIVKKSGFEDDEVEEVMVRPRFFEDDEMEEPPPHAMSDREKSLLAALGAINEQLFEIARIRVPDIMRNHGEDPGDKALLALRTTQAVYGLERRAERLKES